MLSPAPAARRLRPPQRERGSEPTAFLDFETPQVSPSTRSSGSRWKVHTAASPSGMASTSTPTPWGVPNLIQICYEVPSSQTALVQAGVYLYLHVAAQGIGDGTALISLLRGVLESFGVEAGDPPVDVEDHRGNLQLV